MDVLRWKLFQVERQRNISRSWTTFVCDVKRYSLILVHAYGHKETRNWCVLVKPLRIEKARECLVHDTEGDRYGLQPLVRAPSSHPLTLSPIFLLFTSSFLPSTRFHSLPSPSVPFYTLLPPSASWQRPSTYTFRTTDSLNPILQLEWWSSRGQCFIDHRLLYSLVIPIISLVFHSNFPSIDYPCKIGFFSFNPFFREDDSYLTASDF